MLSDYIKSELNDKLKKLIFAVFLIILSIFSGILVSLPLYLVADNFPQFYKYSILILVVAPLLIWTIIRILNNLKKFLRFMLSVIVISPIFMVISLIPSLGIGITVYYFGTNYPSEYKICIVLLFSIIIILYMSMRFFKKWNLTHSIIEAFDFLFASWIKWFIYLVTILIGIPYSLQYWNKNPLLYIPLTILFLFFIIAITNLKYFFNRIKNLLNRNIV